MFGFDGCVISFEKVVSFCKHHIVFWSFQLLLRAVCELFWKSQQWMEKCAKAIEKNCNADAHSALGRELVCVQTWTCLQRRITGHLGKRFGVNDAFQVEFECRSLWTLGWHNTCRILSFSLRLKNRSPFTSIVLDSALTLFTPETPKVFCGPKHVVSFKQQWCCRWWWWRNLRGHRSCLYNKV